MTRLKVYFECDVADFYISASQYSTWEGTETDIYILNTNTWEEITIPCDFENLFCTFCNTVEKYERITGTKAVPAA